MQWQNNILKLFQEIDTEKIQNRGSLDTGSPYYKTIQYDRYGKTESCHERMVL